VHIPVSIPTDNQTRGCDEKPASRTANAVTTAVRHGIVQKKIIWRQQ
jgi:hypothetical protein